MVYPNTHLYVTLHWRMMLVTNEWGQTGFRVDMPTMPDATARDAVADATALLWGSTAMALSDNFDLQEIKFAMVGPDGLYPPGEDAIVDQYVPTIPGVDTDNSTFALQTAHVCTLKTAVERGRAARGRMYFPPPEQALSGGAWTNTVNQNRANQVAIWLAAVNSALPGPVSVFSNVGTGLARPVTRVEFGSRPDVQRRRARQVTEAYSGTDI